MLAYEIPYQNMVPSDPSMEDMKKKVVDEGARPPIDPNWKEDEVRMDWYLFPKVPVCPLLRGSTVLFNLRIKDHLPIKDSSQGPSVSFIERFHCII